MVEELDQEKITKSIVNQGVKCKFNSPLATHFSGAHQTMIKAAKQATYMYAILGNAETKDKELMTAFTGADALLNSRPLTYQLAYYLVRLADNSHQSQ